MSYLLPARANVHHHARTPGMGFTAQQKATTIIRLWNVMTSMSEKSPTPQQGFFLPHISKNGWVPWQCRRVCGIPGACALAAEGSGGNCRGLEPTSCRKSLATTKRMHCSRRLCSARMSFASSFSSREGSRSATGCVLSRPPPEQHPVNVQFLMQVAYGSAAAAVMVTRLALQPTASAWRGPDSSARCAKGTGVGMP